MAMLPDDSLRSRAVRQRGVAVISRGWLMIGGIVSVLTLLAQASSAAEPTLYCDWEFAAADDRNFDDWPDGWQRRSDRQHPDYLRITLRHEAPELAECLDQFERAQWVFRRLMDPARAESTSALWQPQGESLSDRWLDRRLWIEVDAGEVELTSPPIPVRTASSYRLTSIVGCQRLIHSDLTIELQFLDSADEVLDRIVTEGVTGDTETARLVLGPVSPPPGAVTARLVIGVASRDRRRDVMGSAYIDALRLEQLPQLFLSSDRPEGLYPLGTQPALTCRVSGLANPVSTVDFELLDPFGRQLTRESVAMTRPVGTDAPEGASEAVWRPMIREAGFYRCRATLHDDAGRSIVVQQGLVMFDQLGQGVPDLYGLSLAAGHGNLRVRQLPGWLQSLHLAWIKYPCWIDATGSKEVEELAWLVERLQDHHVQCVGLLDRPPEKHQKLLGMHSGGEAANVFHDPRLWQPLLEPILRRLSMRLQWWQLGADDDFSFVGHPKIVDAVEDVRSQLQGFGQPIRVAVPWSWNDPPPRLANADGWRAISLASDQPLSPGELEVCAQSFGEAVGPERQLWVSIDPLPPSRYRLDTRVSDLVQQMIAVRRSPQIAAAFLPAPFDPACGLLEADGTPGELLAPFRTTAVLLSGLRYVGRLELPSGSPNAVLTDDQRAVVVVWNHRPVEEMVYLGEQVAVVDVWGRRRPIPTRSAADHPVQQFAVDRWPQFIVGVDPQVVRWQLAIDVEPTRLDSLLGKPQELMVTFGNHGSQTVAGRVAFHLPDSWQSGNLYRDLLLEAGHTRRESLPVMLRSDTQAGTNKLRIDLQLEGERSYRFSVWRDVEVGPRNVEMQIDLSFDRVGQLVVRQEIISNSLEPQLFDCLLFAPGRQRQRVEILVPPGSRVNRSYVWPNGADMVGREIWLRAEQLGTARVLNYRQVVEGP
jgi:hypothetical protein